MGIEAEARGPVLKFTHPGLEISARLRLYNYSHRRNHRIAPGLELIQTAAPYELAVSGIGSGSFGIFYPVYVGGQAYPLAHRGAEAAAEFQKILDYPGIGPADQM